MSYAFIGDIPVSGYIMNISYDMNSQELNSSILSNKV